MSEPQFSYSNLTLDELRSMAASPQVGSIQAMPQSFHALADRVGEVADLLSHAQADLPNWWKGPAAEQAAATLGRAAAEAREFHGSALAAASAVSRCAQVVAEQQHQMMNVPEVTEPGTTDVVQRPATPFEALEAARQDASYQAAHQQAVQTVNGIAAQYEETRSQLAAINLFSGEDFSSPGGTDQHLVGPFASPNGSPPASVKASEAKPRNVKGSTSSAEISRHYIAQEDPAVGRERALNAAKPTRLSKSPTDAASSSKVGRPTAPLNGEGPNLKDPISTFPQPLETTTFSTSAPSSKESALTDNCEYETPTGTSRQPLKAQTVIQTSARDASSLAALKPEETIAAKASDTIEQKYGQMRYSSSPKEVSHQTGSAIEVASIPQIQPAKIRSLDNEAIDGNAAMIPPFSSIGSVRNEGERRSPRPAYLKERQSTWLPDILAAPADGVIAPDWFEQL